ncbi:unnamed protein product [Allacma fusca]|uniref:Uncharacterized protein n=1 Tax=Allacma fusca TaxID=39272 RepID=A0A8J2NR62_9HEXA|nr:unnamed protein product [Allacma fusca]
MRHIFFVFLSQLWFYSIIASGEEETTTLPDLAGSLNSTREGRGLLDTISGFIKTAQTVNQIFGTQPGGNSASVSGLNRVQQNQPENQYPSGGTNEPGNTNFYNNYYQNLQQQQQQQHQIPAEVPGPPYPESANSVYYPSPAGSSVNKQGQLPSGGGGGGLGQLFGGGSGLGQLLNGGNLNALGQLLGGGNGIAQLLGGLASSGQAGGLLGQLAGSTSQLGGSSGQFGGSNGQFGGSSGQFGGSSGQLGGSSGQFGGSSGQFGGSSGQFGGSSGQFGGSSGQFGGSSGQFGGSSGQLGGLLSQLGGSSGQFGGSPGQLGGSSGQGQLGQLLASSGLLPASLNELGIFDDLTDLLSIQNMEKLLKNVNQFDSLKCIPRMVCQTVARRQEEAERLEREQEEFKRTSTTTTTTTTKRPKTKYTKRKDESQRDARFLPGWKVQGVDTALEQVVKFLDLMQLKDWSLYPYLQGAYEGNQVKSWNECASKFNTCPFSEEQLLYYFNNYKGGLFQSFRSDKDST